MERKLTTILAADVVGYAALMEHDEKGTHERLKAGRKELFEPEIARHHGHVFKLMGDGMLAEFGSVVDAVECAVSLQRGLAERNANVPEDQRVHVRVGINLGEVIVEGDDRYGEGVNIAARLEQLADSDGICVSGKVAREVEKKLTFGFEPMGAQRVKNIAEPVEAFRVKLDGLPVKRKAPISPRRALPWAAAAVAVAALAAIWFMFMGPAGAPSVTATTPSIAVLPFSNMSGDVAQDHLGPGVAEDIITVLSTYPGLRVVSRTSSFAYDKAIKVQQVAADLGVAYVLEGSVKKMADGTVRVTAQLIDGQTGDHVWASRMDKQGDVVVLQEDVANAVYNSLAGFAGEIRKDEERRAWSKSAPSLEEYDYYLRGHQYFFRWTGEDNARARAIWQEGLVKFPDSALLRIKLAATYATDIFSERSADPVGDAALGWKLLEEARAEPDLSRQEVWLLHWLSANFLRLHKGDFVAAAAEAEAAIRLVPYDALSHGDLADVLWSAGRPERAAELAEFAIRRDPHLSPGLYNLMAFSLYSADRPKDALAWLEKAAEPSDFARAVIYVRLGEMDEAHAAMARIRQASPDYTIEDEARWPTGNQPLMAEPYLSAYLDDLRKAGLPEK